MNCIDTATDAVYVGREYLLECISSDCKERGCFWRRFHELPPDRLTKPPTQEEMTC